MPATVEESTPPDMATTTVVSDGFNNPIEFGVHSLVFILISNIS